MKNNLKLMVGFLLINSLMVAKSENIIVEPYPDPNCEGYTGVITDRNTSNPIEIIPSSDEDCQGFVINIAQNTPIGNQIYLFADINDLVNNSSSSADYPVAELINFSISLGNLVQSFQIENEVTVAEFNTLEKNSLALSLQKVNLEDEPWMPQYLGWQVNLNWTYFESGDIIIETFVMDENATDLEINFMWVSSATENEMAVKLNGTLMVSPIEPNQREDEPATVKLGYLDSNVDLEAGDQIYFTFQ